jgi:hypothetical protein
MGKKNQAVCIFHLFSAYVPYFEKIKGSLWDHFAVCVSVYLPTTAAWEWISKNVPAAMNTHTTKEELFDAVFSVQYVSYQILSM